MALAILDGISDGTYNPGKIAKNFLGWWEENKFTPHGIVFDIGNATRIALDNLSATRNYRTSGLGDALSNGNGSLMRCLPLVFLIKDMEIDERYSIIKEVSGMTHSHILSVFCNFFYLEVARQIMKGNMIADAYFEAQTIVREYGMANFTPAERNALNGMDLLLWEDISNCHETDIHSTGYVLHTLEASLWCLMTTDSYEEAVLKAVNLGDDTDTTGAVTGGLAGLFYGYYKIPAEWVKQLAKFPEITEALITAAANLYKDDTEKE